MNNEGSSNTSAEAIAINCKEVIQRYRQGGQQDQAIQSLAETLQRSGGFSALPVDIKMLDDHDHEVQNAGAHGEIQVSRESSRFLEATVGDSEREGADDDGVSRANSITLSQG